MSNFGQKFKDNEFYAALKLASRFFMHAFRCRKRGKKQKNKKERKKERKKEVAPGWSCVLEPYFTQKLSKSNFK